MILGCDFVGWLDGWLMIDTFCWSTFTYPDCFISYLIFGIYILTS